MSKPRKKKITNGRINEKQKEINAILNICIQGIRFLGDCGCEPRAVNIQKLWTHLRGTSHEIGMNYFLKYLNTPKEWSAGVVCIFKNHDDPNYYDVHTASAIIESSNLSEVSCCISDVLLGSINAILDYDESLTMDRFVRWGYFFEPEVSDRLSTKLDGLADVFMNLGDITKFEPFGEELPGFKSKEDIIPNAIRDNGVFPRIREIKFVRDE